MALFENANYDFIKWRWHAIALSAAIIIAGFVFAATKGVPLGIDFSGGTIVVVKFSAPVTAPTNSNFGKVTTAVASAGAMRFFNFVMRFTF